MRRAFAKILRILLAAATVFAGSILEGTAKKEELRLDASSEEKMQQSFFKMLMALDDTDQQKFSSAMAIIGVMMQQRDGETKFGKLKDILDGKTADEIIATARRMTPYIKQHSKILDGSTPEKFGKSISLVMISLPEDLQPAFSEAIAKLMFDAKQNKEDESVLRKKLDGKNGEEVIAMASKIDLPFDPAPKSGTQKEYSIAPLTEAEREKMNLPKRPEEKKEKSYEESLVPTAN